MGRGFVVLAPQELENACLDANAEAPGGEEHFRGAVVVDELGEDEVPHDVHLGDHADAAPHAVWDALSDFPTEGVTLFGTDGKPPVCTPDAARRTFALPPLTRAVRIAFYRCLTGEDAPEPVAERTLTPAQIVAAARVAGAGEDAVMEACQPAALIAHATLASPLPCPYTWDDLVLAPGIPSGAARTGGGASR